MRIRQEKEEMRMSVALSGVVVGLIGIGAVLAGCGQSSSNAGGAGSLAPAGQSAGAGSAQTIAGPTSRSTVAYSPKTVTPQISGTTVSISAGEVTRNGMENFYVSAPGGNMSFMAYQLDGRYHVRADLCVPCGSRSFTLQKGTLICDSCGTVFNGATGAGIRGAAACMSYAKKAATYTADASNISMNMNDLITAYQNTLNRRG
jgi:hypothetical protein